MQINRFFRKNAGKSTAVVGVSAIVALSVAGIAMASSSADSHGVHVTDTSTHSVQVAWRAVGSAVKDEVLVYNASTNQLVEHAALESGHSTGRMVDFGTGHEGQALAVKVAYVVDGKNTGWSSPVTFYTNAAAGPAGEKGDTGPAGPAGPAGPSGIVSSTVHTLVDKPMVVKTGGSFTAQEQLAGTVDNLKAGTYLVTVSAKVAWASGTGVYPEFFVYDGTPSADFSNNLFNVGNGALPDGNATLDSYYTGTAQITVKDGETPHVYAFGYDQNRGVGSYTLEGLTVTATQLQVAAS